MEDGLRTSLDAAGNLVGVLPGSDPAAAPFMTGSHIDTVIGGGRFDGIAGVLAGVELARCLRDEGIQLRHPLHVVDFLAEEPTEFGVSTVGSRGMVGALDRQMLERHDRSGRSLAEAISQVGGRPDELAAGALRQPGEVGLFLELHIEQGPVLELEGLTVGVVTGITGIHRLKATLVGRPDHAGTTPMSIRRDALSGAAEIVLELERLCQGDQGVGTVGVLDVQPGAPNVVPGLVALVAEMRSVHPQFLEDRWAAFDAAIRRVAQGRELGLELETLSLEEPVPVPPNVVAVLSEACAKLGLPVRQMPSGAGHDANQLAKIAPTGMVFVPCKDGRSHCPEEWASMDDVAVGLQVLATALLDFDAQ